jgi:pimeloyl-ACP methyl ester carboxylesterase
LRDPISGAHIAERIRERLPHAPFVALHDVAHWPTLEAPEASSQLPGYMTHRPG